ncbi:hypothetical protein [Streptomyces asiaticus]|uniref:hypothetical protein n=1 Tax=Streptomyces asiaticus TaxID=114695 RepID=UPI003D7352A1
MDPDLFFVFLGTYRRLASVWIALMRPARAAPAAARSARAAADARHFVEAGPGYLQHVAQPLDRVGLAVVLKELEAVYPDPSSPTLTRAGPKGVHHSEGRPPFTTFP